VVFVEEGPNFVEWHDDLLSTIGRVGDPDVSVIRVR